MKRLFLLSAAVLFGSICFAQASENDNLSASKKEKRQKNVKEWRIKDDGVEINGVIWATRNVDKPGWFVGSPQFYGNRFRPKEIQTACPEGWRLPTTPEFQSLVNSGYEWTHIYDVYGFEFGYGENTIFLPATVRTRKDFSQLQEPMNHYFNGFYWTSTVEKGEAYGQRLHFSPYAIDPYYYAGNWGYFNIRCVKE